MLAPVPSPAPEAVSNSAPVPDPVQIPLPVSAPESVSAPVPITVPAQMPVVIIVVQLQYQYHHKCHEERMMFFRTAIPKFPAKTYEAASSLIALSQVLGVFLLRVFSQLGKLRKSLVLSPNPFPFHIQRMETGRTGKKNSKTNANTEKKKQRRFIFSLVFNRFITAPALKIACYTSKGRCNLASLYSRRNAISVALAR